MVSCVVLASIMRVKRLPSIDLPRTYVFVHVVPVPVCTETAPLKVPFREGELAKRLYNYGVV